MSLPERNAPIELPALQQRSGEWRDLRTGIITASRFADIMPGERTKYKQGWWTLLYRLVAERCLGRSFERDISEQAAVKWGIDHEPFARNAFEKEIKLQVTSVGFVWDANQRYGCSPDGFIEGREELIQIKCPQPPKMMEILLKKNTVEESYWAQIQGELMICARERSHFWAWHPEMPAYYFQANRDEEYIALLRSRLTEFCDKLDEETWRAKNLPGWPDG